MVIRDFLLVLLLVMFITSITSASATSVDSEIKKLTNYAEEYETGNINYVQFLVYSSAVREKMNEILGATGREMGGILKEEQLRSVLGESTEETRWVWVENEEKEKKMDREVPVWRKIVFDGRKIQIRLNAWPSIFSKREFEEDGGSENDKNKELEDLEGKLIYRLNFEIEFKKPEEQLNIQDRIDDIKTLAQIFNSDSSSGNAEALAKESVNAERTFESYFRQSGGKCEDIMRDVFGIENKRDTQQLLVQEISFCEGDNFEVVARLEMCDECEWNWINVDFRFEGRGPGFKPQEEEANPISPRSFEDMDSAGFEVEVKRIVDGIKQSCDNKDFGSIMSARNRLWSLNDAWNQESNDVWKDVEEIFPKEQPEDSEDPYWWIKQDQKQRQEANQLRKQNYEKRKQFYIDLFSDYEKKEFYFTQVEFEKRLVEEFKERGEEICNNNQDDNENEAIDCADDQCGGKICGKGIATVSDGNETTTTEVDYYCISGTCQAKEEGEEPDEPVCGDHVCESPEALECLGCEEEICPTIYCIPCAEDCAKCPEHEPIECSGKVIFKGEDENGCPLEPICIEETEFCSVDEDCPHPLCGAAACVRADPEDEFGTCQIITLTKCEQGECEDGEKQIKECDNGEKIVTGICKGGVWGHTDVECSGVEEPPGESCDQYCWDYMSTITPSCPGDLEISGTYPDCNCDWVCHEIVGNECTVKGDCGGEHDVCSNGECVTIPQTIPVEPEEPVVEEPEEPEEPVEEPVGESVEETQESEPEPESNSESGIEGNVILGFITSSFSRLTTIGNVIVGFEVEEGDTGDTGDSSDAGSDDAGDTGGNDDNGNGDAGGDSGGDETDGDDGGEEEPPNGDGDEQDPGPGPEPDNECRDKWKACGDPCPPCDYDQGPGEEGDWDEGGQEDDRDWERKDEEERERHEEEQRERCKGECSRPCVEKCIREVCGESMDCDIDKESKSCESGCSPDDDCITKCMEGGDWWMEFEDKDEHKEEKGVFQVGGSCRTSQGKTEGFIWFGGWGDPFEQIQFLKNKYYSGGEADWCKHDFENLKKQRQEFEKGFNQEFVAWFFEKYLTNSAEDWEQSVSGIFELYWKDVDNSREMAYRMQCLGIDELPNINLVNVEYDSEYGSIEFWEEIKIVRLPGMDKGVQVVSPYMKAWVFPTKEFMEYEMEKAMENHEFPGPPEERTERENEEGPTAEEREMIKQDDKFMKRIREISEEYGGNLDVVVRFVDNGSVIFNLYVQVNENDIIKIKPMLPEEVPEEDVRIDIEFQRIYDIIYMQEKEMRGQRIESPPWDRKIQPIQGIKNVVNNVKMYFKVRSLLNSAEIYPETDEKEVRALMKSFFKMMMKSEKDGGPEMGPGGEGEDIGEEKGVWEEKGKITGEVIFN